MFQQEDHLLLLEQRRRLLHTIHGVIPLCASCKRVRLENDEWESIEAYITHHSEGMTSHGICPECLEKLYPELAEKVKHH